MTHGHRLYPTSSATAAPIAALAAACLALMPQPSMSASGFDVDVPGVPGMVPDQDPGIIVTVSSSSPGAITTQPKPKPKPKVTIQNPVDKTGGDLPDDYLESVRKTLRSRMPTFQQCYANAFAKNPGMGKGKLTVDLVISGDGHPGTVEVVSDTVGSAEVAACVKGKLSTVHFDDPASAPAKIGFGIVFAPPEIVPLIEFGPKDAIVKVSGDLVLEAAPIDIGAFASVAGAGSLESAMEDVDPTRVLVDQVRASIPGMQQCLAKALAKKPDTVGRVLVNVTIGANGKVKKVKVVADETGYKPVAKCLTKGLKAMAFAAAGKGSVTWQVPVRVMGDQSLYWPLPDPLPLTVALDSAPAGIGEDVMEEALSGSAKALTSCFSEWLSLDPDAAVVLYFDLAASPGSKPVAKVENGGPHVHSGALSCVVGVLGSLPLEAPTGSQPPQSISAKVKLTLSHNPVATKPAGKKAAKKPGKKPGKKTAKQPAK